MKNRKRIVTTFVILAVLCLGVGYAALADDLYIGGSASVNVVSGEGEDETPFEQDFDGDVYFDGAEANSPDVTTSIGADKNGDAKDKLTITINDTVFTKKDASTEVTVYIKNDSADYAVEITPETNNFSDGENFRIDCKWTDNDGSNVIGTNSQKNMTITITLVKPLLEDISEETFEISFNATAAVPQP